MRDLTPATFRQAVARGEALVLFYADWSLLCGQLKVTLREMKAELPQLFSVDIDREPELHAECRVFCVPTLILFRDGEEIGQKVGNLPPRWLRWWLEMEIQHGCKPDSAAHHR